MRILTFFAALLWVITVQAQKMDSVSYSLGILLGQNLRQQGIEQVDAAALANAINDVLGNKPLKVEAAEANRIVQDYMQGMQAKKHEKGIAEGKAYLEANAKRKEVKTLPSGLQYEIMTAGNGPVPTANDRVTVHYHGTLIDGTVFDSSVDRGQPATFGVTQVIQGWIEALQLMPTGSKWKLHIPYNLAYGERSPSPKIGPFSTLVFEVELISIN
jgi:FKBP-type peptidyl-prolyl cis-trans isomerase FklB